MVKWPVQYLIDQYSYYQKLPYTHFDFVLILVPSFILRNQENYFKAPVNEKSNLSYVKVVKYSSGHTHLSINALAIKLSTIGFSNKLSFFNFAISANCFYILSVYFTQESIRFSCSLSEIFHSKKSICVFGFSIISSRMF